MSFLDDLRNDMGKESTERYEELKHREASGDIDDMGRRELEQLKERFFNDDNS